MKTLDQVEPRIPIKSSDLPLVITQPGSYYATEHLHLSDANTTGILVVSHDVAIDLCGYSLYGPGKTTGEYGAGIARRGWRLGLSVVNGGIYNWRGSGIDLGNSEHTYISRVLAWRNGMDGISPGQKAIVKNCSVRDNLNCGIRTGSWSIISECTVVDSIGVGIQVEGGDCIVEKCIVVAGQSVGIRAGSTATVRENTVINTGGHGIEVGSNANVLSNMVRDVGNNHYYGVLTDAAAIRATGIHSRIESNHVTNSHWGVQVTGARNLIIKNSAGGNTDNFGSIALGNIVGDIVTSATMATSTNANANFEF